MRKAPEDQVAASIAWLKRHGNTRNPALNAAADRQARIAGTDQHRDAPAVFKVSAQQQSHTLTTSAAASRRNPASLHRWVRRGFILWAVISTLWIASSYRMLANTQMRPERNT